MAAIRREPWQTFAVTPVWLVEMLLQTLANLVPFGLLLGIFIAVWRTPPVRTF